MGIFFFEWLGRCWLLAAEIRSPFGLVVDKKLSVDGMMMMMMMMLLLMLLLLQQCSPSVSERFWGS